MAESRADARGRTRQSLAHREAGIGLVMLVRLLPTARLLEQILDQEGVDPAGDRRLAIRADSLGPDLSACQTCGQG
jgi:hypothetical protein